MMICDNCGRSGIRWMGPLTNLTHTECPHCGGANCQRADVSEVERSDVPEIECPECFGNGVEILVATMAYALTDKPCRSCHGTGWRPMNENELDAATEQQAEDAMSEPPITMAEEHRRAWDLHQETHRR